MISEIHSEPITLNDLVITDQEEIAMLVAVKHKLPPSKREFAESMIGQFNKKQHLSEKQWEWVNKLTKMGEQAGSGPLSPKSAPSAMLPQLPGVIEAFAASASPDAKLKKLLIGVSENPDDGKLRLLMVPGKSYLKVAWQPGTTSGAWTYRGIISKDGDFKAAFGVSKEDISDEAIFEALLAFSKDPVGTMKGFGQAFGICACCGLTLTHPASVSLSFGPKCSENLGFGDKWKALAKELGA